MKEEWRDIEGYEGLYQVSNLGRVMSLRYYGGNRHEIKTPSGNGTGYLKVQLSKKGVYKQYLVHRLVAKAFIPNPNNYGFVNHKDENKTNNCVDNLEWCTKSYNSIYYLNMDERRKKEYASRFLDKTTGKNLSPMLEKRQRKYLSKVAQKSLNGEIIKIYENISRASEETGIRYADLRGACVRRRKNKKAGKAHGFIWEFCE